MQDLRRAPEPITCPFCYGHGFIEWPSEPATPCEPCDGSGEVWIVAEVKRGHATIKIVKEEDHA